MKTKIVILLLMVSVAMSAQKVYTFPFIEDDNGELILPIVKISISGSDKLFLVDCGSQRSIISEKEIRGLKHVMKVDLLISTAFGETFNRIMDVYLVPILGISHNFAADDLSGILKANRKYKIGDISAILGADFLNAHKAIIDYDKKTLTITIF